MLIKISKLTTTNSCSKLEVGKNALFFFKNYKNTVLSLKFLNHVLT